MADSIKKTAAKRLTIGSAASANGRDSSEVDGDRARTFAAKALDGASIAEKFGNASFSIDRKVFAFTRRDGLVLKLPPELLAEVIAKRGAAPLVMGKRVMREWVLLRLPGPQGYLAERELMRAARDYVVRMAAKKSRVGHRSTMFRRSPKMI